MSIKTKEEASRFKAKKREQTKERNREKLKNGASELFLDS